MSQSYRQFYAIRSYTHVVDERPSMATIYNTLHQFTSAGLLRKIPVEGSTAFFDTNITPHAHFLVEETGDLVDIPAPDLKLIQPPKAPDGYEIDRVEMVIRVKRSSDASKGPPRS